MHLFEAKDRTDKTFKSSMETTFRYFDRSARPEVARARDLLNDWFSRVEGDEQPRLKADLTSSDEVQHASAVFELAIHEIGIRLGYTPKIHPPMPGTATVPDFRFSRGSETLLIEAKNVTSSNPKRRGADQRKEQMYEALDKFVHPDFTIQVHDVRGAPINPVPVRALGAEITAWLGTLSYETLRGKDRRDLPVLPRNKDGWYLEFRAIPKPQAWRGEGKHLISSRLSGGPGTGSVPIVEALRDKAKKYGELKEPYLIALNLTGRYTDQEDLENALFGTASVRVYLDTRESEEVRKPNGLWLGKEGWAKKHVSGVLVFHDYNVWRSGVGRPVLYLHPSATLPLDGPFTSFTRRVVGEDGYLKEQDGALLGHVFELPEEWPEI